MVRALRNGREINWVWRPITEKVEEERTPAVAVVSGRPRTGAAVGRAEAFMKGLSYEVRRDGAVEYSDPKGPVLRERSGQLELLRDDRQAVRLASSRAKELYGERFRVSGSARATRPMEAERQMREREKERSRQLGR